MCGIGQKEGKEVKYVCFFEYLHLKSENFVKIIILMLSDITSGLSTLFFVPVTDKKLFQC